MKRLHLQKIGASLQFAKATYFTARKNIKSYKALMLVKTKIQRYLNLYVNKLEKVIPGFTSTKKSNGNKNLALLLVQNETSELKTGPQNPNSSGS